MVDFGSITAAGRGAAALAMGIPDSLQGWLLGPMLAWFGILYYGLTEDVRWYVAGLVIFGLSFLAFPIRRRSM